MRAANVTVRWEPVNCNNFSVPRLNFDCGSCSFYVIIFLNQATTVLLSSVLAVSLLGGCRASDKPVTLTVWTYYNGDQLASFERLVEEFKYNDRKKRAYYGRSLQSGQHQ